jgi:hypothetical protein
MAADDMSERNFHVDDIEEFRQDIAITSTPLAQNLSIVQKCNIRFVGSNVWNSIDENLKGLSKSQFKNKLKNNILNSY